MADARRIELNEDIGRPCSPQSGSVFKRRIVVDVPGSGTSTSWTSTWKSGPSLTTTPALHVLGISNVCTFWSAMV